MFPTSPDSITSFQATDTKLYPLLWLTRASLPLSPRGHREESQTGQKSFPRISHRHRPNSMCLKPVTKGPKSAYVGCRGTLPGVRGWEAHAPWVFLTEEMRRCYLLPPPPTNYFKGQHFLRAPEALQQKANPGPTWELWHALREHLWDSLPLLPWLTAPAPLASLGLFILIRLECVSFCLKPLLDRMHLLR